MSWHDELVTDYRGQFDTGRWIGIVVIISMIFFQAFDLMVWRHPFNAMGFGVGSGGVLTGLWAYLHGDRAQMVAQVGPKPGGEYDT